jgi:hypothetical protein
VAVYSVRGLAAATTAAANQSVITLWNPSSTALLEILELGVTPNTQTGGGPSSRLMIRHVSTRGTAGSTVTPDADNAWDAATAPASGALVDLSNYSVQPTFLPQMLVASFSGVAGSGGWQYVFVPPYPDYPLVVPPGKGITAMTASAVGWPESEVYVAWEED